MKRLRVAMGETVEMVMPEVRTSGLMMKIGGEVRLVRVLDGRVQILEPDGVTAALRYEPPFDLVGIHTDRLGLWVEPVPSRLVQVFRHGKPVSVPMTHAVHAVRWLEDHTPFDAVRALRDEGYEIVDITHKGDALADGRRNDGQATSKLATSLAYMDHAIAALRVVTHAEPLEHMSTAPYPVDESPHPRSSAPAEPPIEKPVQLDLFAELTT
jgi:hypothetical protein